MASNRAQQPTLHTQQLILRPFMLADAQDIQHLAGAPEIAATTLNIPHPYEDGMAEAWIKACQTGFETGTSESCIRTCFAKNWDDVRGVSSPASSEGRDSRTL
jgi:hypothetical protein